MDFLTDAQLQKLYNKSYYLLNILLQLEFNYSDSVPTMGVTYSNKKLRLVANKQFVESLTEDQQLAVLLHEALHIEYNHLFLDKSLFPDPMRLNVATDCAINSHKEISWLKDSGLGVFAADYKLPEGETTAFYYANLPEEVKSDANGGEGQHSHEALPEDAVGEVLKVKHKASKATEIKRQSVQAVQAPYDWRKTLANFIASSDEYDRKVSWKKSNRRDSALPGSKKLRHLSVAVVIDTSGSMVQHLGLLVGQVASIADSAQAEVTLLQCDAQVTLPPKVYRKGEAIELVGGGGTLYQPGLDAASKLNPDVIIYLGDMEHFDNLVKPGCQVLFFNVVSRTKPNASFGKFLHL